ncbi:MAG: hypothetical protein EHM20_02235 [Alphaproteobacteria bacterium]|nr:MAG: hypothetical protein EHM20_02235 [Alphaproteobacteria bacterium]
MICTFIWNLPILMWIIACIAIFSDKFDQKIVYILNNTFLAFVIISTYFVLLTFLYVYGKLLRIYYERIVALENFWLNYKKAQRYKGPYLLVLRSFDLDDMYLKELREKILMVDVIPGGGVNTYDTDAEHTIEKTNMILTLSQALENYGLLVLMGGELEDTYLSEKGNYFYVHSSPDWRTNFELLADHSKAIIVFPELSNGLYQIELPYICSRGLLDKTLFIMPPVYTNLVSGEKKLSLDDSQPHRWDISIDQTRSHRWDSIRNQFTNQGLFIPEYDANGQIFTLDKSGNIAKDISLQGDEDIRSLSIAFNGIMSESNFVYDSGSNFDEIFHNLILYKNYTTPFVFNSVDDIPGYNFGFVKKRNNYLKVIVVLILFLFGLNALNLNSARIILLFERLVSIWH